MDAVRRNVLRQKLIISTTIGVCCGVAIGFILKQNTRAWSEREIMYLKFPGELFMRFVNLLILPLVTSSIVSATCNLRKSGSIGLMALSYYATTTVLGIILSIVLVQTIRPGELLKNENILSAQGSVKYSMTMDTLLDLFRNLVPDNLMNACLVQYRTVLKNPKNDSVPLEEWKIGHENLPGTNVLGLVFFSLIMGLAIGNMKSDNKPLIDFFESSSEATMKIMNWAIKVVPISVFFLISAKVLEVEDFSSIIKRLGIYIATVFAGLLIQGLILLPMLYFIITRKSPYKILLKLGPAFGTACGTSSSTATVPMTLKCLEDIGIKKKVAKFIVPLGATINMDGIALYETVGAIFIIQLHGLEFSLFKIIIISITCTLSCIGAGGLPNGGYVMLIMVLNSVGVPVEDVSLIIAIDWFADRFRTTVNIIADALGASIISLYYVERKNSEEEEMEMERKK